MLCFYEVTTNLNRTHSQGKYRNFDHLMTFHLMNHSIILAQTKVVSLFWKTYVIILSVIFIFYCQIQISKYISQNIYFFSSGIKTKNNVLAFFNFNRHRCGALKQWLLPVVPVMAVLLAKGEKNHKFSSSVWTTKTPSEQMKHSANPDKPKCNEEFFCFRSSRQSCFGMSVACSSCKQRGS